jgi:branched-chain amino acid transport system permease protein
MVIVGGMGSLKGSIAGALIFVALPELLRLLNISASAAGTINQLIFGLILVLFMILRPQGIFGRYRILNE